MADLKKTIEIIFAGVDEMSGPLSAMEKNLSSFGSDLQDIGAPFADAVEKVALLNAAIAGIAVAGIAASANIENETVKMAASLGLPTEEAEHFAEVAKEVYKAGFGEDLAASFNTVTLAVQKLGDSAEVDIGKVSDQALRLESLFSVDINESLGAVSTLMSNFGLTSNEAMGFIVSGFQEGLNGSDDFIDSINEYANQFSNGGASAGEFFSVLKTGFQEGIIGTDAAGDAFKEFSDKILTNSNATQEALTSIGIDPDALQASLASGETTVAKAFDSIIKHIAGAEDQSTSFIAGAELMGEPFIKMGLDATIAIDATKTKIGELGDAVNDIDTKTFTEKFNSALNTITVAFGDMMVWNDIKDDISDIFLDIAQSFDEAIGQTDFSGVKDAFGEIWDVMQDALSDQDLDITNVEGMQNALELVADSLESVAKVTKGIVEAFEPIFDIVLNITKAFNGLDPDMQELIGNITGLGAALSVLGGIIAAGGALIGGIGTFAGFFTAGGAMSVGISSVIALLTGPAGLTAAMFAVAVAGANFFAGDTFQQWAANTKAAIANADFGTWAKQTGDYFQQVNAESSKNLTGMDASLLTTGKAADDAGQNIQGLVADTEMIPAHKQTDIEVDADLDTIDDTLAGLDTIPAHKETDFSMEGNQASIDRVKDAVNDAAPDEKKTDALMVPDAPSIADAKEKINDAVPDEKETKGVLTPDKPSFSSTKSAIDDAVPESKIMEIQLQGDIDMELARIEAQAATVQSAFEWEAKVEIANAEAMAEQVTAAFDAVASSVSATAAAAADMFGSLVGAWGDINSGLDRNDLMAMVQQQLDMEQQALNIQSALTDAQIEYMRARASALKAGDGLIQISSDGLEPALEMIMWQILEKVQLRVTETASEFLFGLGVS